MEPLLCMYCGIAINAPRRKYCSDKCSSRATYRSAVGHDVGDTKHFPPHAGTCVTCGADMSHRTGQARYCSRRCREEARKAAERIRRRQKPRQECKHPLCGNEVPLGRWKFCSAECTSDYRNRAASPYGFGDRCAVWFKPCPHCGVLVTMKARNQPNLCQPCRRASELARYRKKNYERRAKGKPLVTVVELAAMHGARCHLCKRKVDMNLPGRDPMGPTVDHLIPVSAGGTNETVNLALAHRICNVRRNNRGPAQLRLVA